METTHVEQTTINYFASLPADFTTASLPPFMLTGLARTKVGKAALKYAEQNNGSFVGFNAEAAEQKPTTNRVSRPDNIEDGMRFCGDCYRKAIEAGQTHEDAVQSAIQAETEFATIGKNEDGTPKYGSYCKADTALRAKKHAEKVRLTKLPELIANAEARLAELKAEQTELTAKFGNTSKSEETEEVE